MCMGREATRWVAQNNVCTDARIWAIRVKADSFEEQIAAIFKPGDLVIQPLVSKLLL